MTTFLELSALFLPSRRVRRISLRRPSVYLSVRLSVYPSVGANSAESRFPNFRLIKLSLLDIKFCRCCSRNAMNRDHRLYITLLFVSSSSSPRFPQPFTPYKRILKFTLALRSLSSASSPFPLRFSGRIPLPNFAEIRGTKLEDGLLLDPRGSSRRSMAPGTKKREG